jgi:hypothetical protein
MITGSPQSCLHYNHMVQHWYHCFGICACTAASIGLQKESAP